MSSLRRNFYLALLPIFKLAWFSVVEFFSCMSSEYILGVKPCSTIQQIVLLRHIIMLTFFTLCRSFLIWCNFIYFHFDFPCLWGYVLKNIYNADIMGHMYYLFFLLFIFMVSGLSYRSWIQFESIFMYGTKEWFSFFPLNWLSRFPTQPVEEMFFSPLYIQGYLEIMLIHVGLLLDCHSIPLIQVSCFYSNTIVP